MGRSEGKTELCLVVLLIVITVLNLPHDGSEKVDGILSHGKSHPRGYDLAGKTVNEMVEIDGNDELGSFIDEIDAPGSGTQSDPFFVDGWIFNETSDMEYWCLCLENTNAHLILKNCIFLGGGTLYKDPEYQGSNIFLSNSRNITIDGCTVLNSLGHGLDAYGSSFAISNSKFRNNGRDGIHLQFCSGEIRNNSITWNHDFGINLYYYSVYDTMLFEDNELIGNGFNVNNKIPDSNTVNGLPIFFIENDINGSFSGDYGQVILRNCTGTMIRDIEITNTTVGIMGGQDIRLRECTIRNCTIGAKGEYDVDSCTFIDNEIGIMFNERSTGELKCKNCYFIDNDVGISGSGQFIIEENAFEANDIGILTSDYTFDLERYIIHNSFIDNRETAIEIYGYRTSLVNFTVVSDNTIINSKNGMDIAGKVRIVNNSIADCTLSSIRLNALFFDKNEIFLDNNILFDAGISMYDICLEYPGDVFINNSTKLDGLPIAWIEHASEMEFSRNYSQYIIYESNDIVIFDYNFSYRKQILISRSENILIDNCLENDVQTIPDFETCSIQVVNSKNVYITNCTVGNTYIGKNIKTIHLYNNDIFGLIFGSGTSITASRNNFFLDVIAYYGWWEYSSQFPFIFDDNYYKKFSESDHVNKSSSDGIHWDQPYQIVTAWDIHPRIHPFGYDGPYDPMIVSDRTPLEVDEGSVLNFSVEIWDPIAITEAWIEVTIDEEDNRIPLDRSNVNNWSGSCLIHLDSLKLTYSVISRSVSGRWANSTSKVVIVNDITSPSLIDRSAGQGTTGDTYIFSADVSDNRELDRVWVRFRWGTGQDMEMDLIPSGTFKGEIMLPMHSLDPMNYSIHALDVSGNSRSVHGIVNVTDNDPPVAYLPYMIDATTGKEVHLDGSLCSDNIGIVDYTWYFNADPGREFRGYEFGYTFATPGVRELTLEVTDASGQTDRAEVYINVTDPPTEPVVRTMIVYFGPVYDNSTSIPIEDVSAILYLDRTYFDLTGSNGIAHFTILEPQNDIEARIILRKEGYQNMTLDTILYSNGKFKIEFARMIPNEKEDDPVTPHHDIEPEGDPDPLNEHELLVLIIAALFLIGSTIAFTWIAIRKARGGSDPGE